MHLKGLFTTFCLLLVLEFSFSKWWPFGIMYTERHLWQWITKALSFQVAEYKLLLKVSSNCKGRERSVEFYQPNGETEDSVEDADEGFPRKNRTAASQMSFSVRRVQVFFQLSGFHSM